MMSSSLSFPCWSAFRTGAVHYAQSTDVLGKDNGILSSKKSKFDATWNYLEVHWRQRTANKSKTIRRVPTFSSML
jgi:hypothetical protein